MKLFKAADLTELSTYQESDWVYGLQWAPDGKTFAIGRFDGTWETHSDETKLRKIDMTRTLSLLALAALADVRPLNSNTPRGNRTTPPTLNSVSPLGISRGNHGRTDASKA